MGFFWTPCCYVCYIKKAYLRRRPRESLSNKRHSVVEGGESWEKRSARSHCSLGLITPPRLKECRRTPLHYPHSGNSLLVYLILTRRYYCKSIKLQMLGALGFDCNLLCIYLIWVIHFHLNFSCNIAIVMHSSRLLQFTLWWQKHIFFLLFLSSRALITFRQSTYTPNVLDTLGNCAEPFIRAAIHALPNYKTNNQSAIRLLMGEKSGQFLPTKTMNGWTKSTLNLW